MKGEKEGEYEHNQEILGRMGASKRDLDKLKKIIFKFVEGQKAGIGKRLGDSRGPEGKSYCLQS